MKTKILTLIALSCVLILSSCSKDDSTTLLDNNVFTLKTIPEDGSTIKSDTWIITDTGAPLYEDYNRLKTAIRSAGRNISLELPNIVTIRDGAFISSPSYLSSIKAPRATSVGKAFGACDMLKYVELPQVTIIRECAFSECIALTSIKLPKVSIVEHSAFRDCEALTAVELPNLTSLGMYVFSDCYSLESLTIATESTVQNIDSAAFREVQINKISLITGKNNGTRVSGQNWIAPDEFSEWTHKGFKTIKTI